MIKFLDWAINKVVIIKGLILTGVDNTKPVLIRNTVFEDKSHQVLGKRLSNNLGRVDYDYNELAVKFQNGGDIDNLNDVIGVNIEYPHKAKENGKIYPHIHLWQEQEKVDRVFTLQYRIQNNGATKATDWARMTASLLNDARLPYTGGTMNQIISFKDKAGRNYIDMTGASLSATLQFKLARTDNNSGDVLVTFFDFHYEVETLGSRQELTR